MFVIINTILSLLFVAVAIANLDRPAVAIAAGIMAVGALVMATFQFRENN